MAHALSPRDFDEPPSKRLGAAIAVSFVLHALLLAAMNAEHLAPPDPAAQAPIVARLMQEVPAADSVEHQPSEREALTDSQKQPAKASERLKSRPAERPAKPRPLERLAPTRELSSPTSDAMNGSSAAGSTTSSTAPTLAPSAPTPAAETRSGAETLPPIDVGSVAKYRVLVHGAAAKHKKYSRYARDRGWEGRTTVRLRIDPTGQLQGLDITQSSGFEELDESAIEMLRKAQRDTPVPANLQGRAFEFELTVVFELRD